MIAEYMRLHFYAMNGTEEGRSGVLGRMEHGNIAVRARRVCTYDESRQADKRGNAA